MFRQKFIFAALLAVFLCIAGARAKADLLISPLRAVFEGRDRSKVITLINTTDEYKTYRLEWKLLEMQNNGSYKDISEFVDKSGVDRSAIEMIRFSPRQVSLEPHGRQRVRLSLRRPADLAPGEYRAHLSITRLADNIAPEADVEGAVPILQVNLGFSIPIIVRQGEGMPKIEISNPRFEVEQAPTGPKPKLKVDLVNKTQNYTAYGKVKAYWLHPDGSKEQIGVLNNVAVYPENEFRTAAISLEADKIIKGSVQIVYEGDESYKGVVFDNRTFTLE